MAGRLVLSTCGTSLLTHGATAGERRRLVACANAGTGELHGRARALIDRRVALAAARLEGDVAAARAASAELNAIVALAGGTNRWARGHGRSDHHRLVHSDTAQGEEAARLLAA